jgi:hypothetical protein
MNEAEPTWDEAAAAFDSAEPVELVRPARTVVIDIARSGGGWIATSDQIEGFLVVRGSRDGLEAAARQDLAEWIDPAVTLEFAEKS